MSFIGRFREGLQNLVAVPGLRFMDSDFQMLRENSIIFAGRGFSHDIKQRRAALASALFLLRQVVLQPREPRAPLS